MIAVTSQLGTGPTSAVAEFCAVPLPPVVPIDVPAHVVDHSSGSVARRVLVVAARLQRLGDRVRTRVEERRHRVSIAGGRDHTMRSRDEPSVRPPVQKLAVSKKSTTSSSAASTTAALSAALNSRPKLLHPRPTVDTDSGPNSRDSICTSFVPSRDTLSAARRAIRSPSEPRSTACYLHRRGRPSHPVAAEVAHPWTAEVGQ